MSWRTGFLLVCTLVCTFWGTSDADMIRGTVYFTGFVVCAAIDKLAEKKR